MCMTFVYISVEPRADGGLQGSKPSYARITAKDRSESSHETTSHPSFAGSLCKPDDVPGLLIAPPKESRSPA